MKKIIFKRLKKAIKLGGNKEIVIPILNNQYKVVVCWGDSEYILKVLHAYYYDDADLKLVKEALENRLGVTFKRGKHYPIIGLPKAPETPQEIGTLAHEACHAVKEIFDAIEETSIDEVFACSVEAIVREVLTNENNKS